MARYYEDARQLAFLITQWTKTINQPRHRFVIATGGGPGIMEAANLGASEAGGKTIGLNIHLPFEQMPNPYITPELNFEFHYFFMRKLWFAYLAKALVVFPGGFGTFDELFELLTLAQTEKLAKRICIVIYGKDYWDRVINFQALVDSGTISPNDLELFHWANTPEEAFECLQADLTKHHLEQPAHHEKEPDITKTRPVRSKGVQIRPYDAHSPVGNQVSGYPNFRQGHQVHCRYKQIRFSFCGAVRHRGRACPYRTA